MKKSLLLILQLAALLFLCIGLARPYIRINGASENKIVIVIDSSASMQSRDISPSRFEAAKTKCIDIINKMGPGDTMLLISAGSKAKVIVPFSSDKKILHSAVSDLTAVDTPCDMRQAMVLALSLVASGKSATPARIVMISDGIFEKLVDLVPQNAKVDFLKIGRDCDNIGITSLSSRKTLSGEQQVFINVQNFSKHDWKFNLEIYLNDQLLNIQEESLKPGEAKQDLLDNFHNLSGRITARLDTKDDLLSDNSATVYLTPQRKLSVLLVSKGNIFLQNALNLDARTQLTKTESVPSDFDKSMYDLVVFDGITPPTSLPQGGYLLVNTSALQGPGEIGQSVNRPVIVDSAKNHPATAYVDFSSIHIQQANYLVPKTWATTIIDGTGGALAVAGSHEGRTFVQLAWSVMDSDFPLRVGFPIFIANCVDWLCPAEKIGSGQSIRTGNPVYIDIPSNISKIVVTDPHGNEDALSVTQTPMMYENTDSVGVYKVTGDGLKKEFACNLASSEISNTTPVNTLMLGNRSFASARQVVQTNREYYWPLILIALVLLTFEWYVYHRRL